MGNILALFLITLLSVFLIAQPESAIQAIVLTHVTIIDMTGAPPKLDMTVVIQGNRIAALGRNSEISIPQNALVINATGKFLIPGLWDMHEHTVYDKAEDTERTFFRC